MTTYGELLNELARKHPDIARHWDEQDARNAKLAEQLRQHCAEALVQIGDALKHPSVSRPSMEAASLAIAKALSVSAAIDPED